jgi:polysaccharide pyruvyl transferase CsaB
MKRIALSGYYGFQNAGDEAVLAGLVMALRAERPEHELEITALSMDPARTKLEHGINAAHRYRIGPVLRTLSRADLVLSGGGSLLQDATTVRSIFYYLALVRMAQLMGKKTMFIAQGIGPLSHKRSRKLTRSVANRCTAITVRDNASRDLLIEIGVTKPITVTADPALLLEPEHLGPPHDERCGLSLRPWRNEEQALADQLAEAYAQALPHVPLLFMPMHGEADSDVQTFFAVALREHLDSAIRIAKPGSPCNASLLMLIASRARMVIGMRLHSLIFAAACSVPAVALAYDPKVVAFMEQSGQADAIYDIRDGDHANLGELLKRVWAERKERSEALHERLPALRAAAAKNAEIALEVLA